MISNPVYARIDLTTGGISEYRVPSAYFRKYMGGKALAARLLLDMTQAGLDPLAPEAMLIINTGPMNGTGAPCSSRFNMSFKNVLTGGIASSNCGGKFGVMLKKAGFDGLIILGRAPKPSVIEALDGTVRVLEAPDLWGLDTEQTQERFPAHYGKLVIGPAGENLVRYACAVSGERVAARCGGGAVMGSKNLKAIVAYGTKRPEVYDREGFDRFAVKWTRFMRRHPMTGDSLPRYGSAGLMNKANATNALPTRNFQRGHYDMADMVSGETIAETALTRNGSCMSCPVRCERRVMLEGREIKGPEYETLGFFGPNIGAHDLDGVIRLNYVCDKLGLDTISAASTIAFAMELKQNGLADFGVEFGDTSKLEDALNGIARREDGWAELGDGSKRLSEKYGGKEYAMHSKGLEMASYEPRRSVGMGLGYATSNRGGCHLGGGYLALLESVGVLSTDAQSPKAKPELAVFMQNGLDAVSSAGFCLFSAQTFVPAIFFRLGPAHWITRVTGKIVTHAGGLVRLILGISPLLRFNSLLLFPHAEALRLATGVKMYTGDFIRLGERCFNLERLYNLREGLTAADDSLPARLTGTPQAEGRGNTVVPLDKMLPRYYAVRGWDENGAPTRKKLEGLGI